MNIKSSEVFDNKVFWINPNLEVKNAVINDCNIAIIDNFYLNINSVNTELKKIPATQIHYTEDNQKFSNKFFDGMKVYSSTRDDSSFPFQGDMLDFISVLTGVDTNFIEPEKRIIVNCFQMELNIDIKNYYFNIHRDRYESKHQIAVVIFLNENYEDGDGINFYDTVIRKSETSWFEKSLHNIEYHVAGKKNRAVVFDSNIPHGPSLSGKLFYEEYRYTQAMFFKIN